MVGFYCPLDTSSPEAGGASFYNPAPLPPYRMNKVSQMAACTSSELPIHASI